MGQARARAEKAGPVIKRRVRDRRTGRECGWCGTWVPYSGRGRPALYCSRPCRQRAFEIRHADIDAAPATPRREVIERTVTEVRDPAPPQRAREWEALLGELVAQLADDDALRSRAFDHPRIYAALTRALAALDAAHPGGLRRLAR
jgi:hypothetical protein